MRAIFGAKPKVMHVSMALSYLGGTAAAGFIDGNALYGYCQGGEDSGERLAGAGWQKSGMCFGYVES
jgi:hypothetical protein